MTATVEMRRPARRPSPGFGPARDLLTLRTLADADLHRMVTRAAHLAVGPAPEQTLVGRTVGTWFRRTSTRTRTAFATAALRLGAHLVTFDADDLQVSTGETLEDTGAVLEGMLDVLICRTAGPDEDLARLAGRKHLAIVNAMTQGEHPTQAITDLAVIEAARGSVDGARVLYLGEGNNTAVALARALCRYRGTHLELRTPVGYGVPAGVLAETAAEAVAHGGSVVQRHDASCPAVAADVVYTSRWQTTGTVKSDPGWRDAFAPFQVDARVVAANPGSLVMHDLPAHRGEEIEAAVIDGPRSVALFQAHTKQAAAMAVLEWSTDGGGL